MKIVGFSGSPRKGANTDRLVMYILEGAANKGAETSFYNLAKMNIKSCISCFACRNEVTCAIKDDMTNLYQEIQSADAIIIGSPVYMWQMSAQTKQFVDRLMPFINPDMSTRLDGNKKAVIAFTQGIPDTNTYMPYFEDTMQMLEFIGFAKGEIVVIGGTIEKDAISNQADAIEKARKTGESLISSL